MRKKAAVILGIIAVLLVIIAAIAPALINSASIKAKIIAATEKAIDAKLDFAKLDLRLLPSLSVKITGIEFDMPGYVSADISAVHVNPKLLQLLIGRVRIDALTVDSSRLSIYNTPLLQDFTKKKQGPEKALKDKMASGLEVVATYLKNSVIKLGSMDAALYRDRKKITSLRELELMIKVSGRRLSIELEAKSDVIKKATLQGRLDMQDLSGSGFIRLDKINTPLLSRLFLPDKQNIIPETVIDLDLEFQTTAMEKAVFNLKAQAPKVRIRRAAQHLDIEQALLETKIDLSARQIRAEVRQLTLANPQIKLAGRALFNQEPDSLAPLIELSIHNSGADLMAVKTAVLSLAQDSRQLHTILDYIQAGAVNRLSMHAAGNSVKELLDYTRLKVNGNITDVRLCFADLNLELNQVNGDIGFEKGAFYGADIALSAQYGNAPMPLTIGGGGKFKYKNKRLVLENIGGHLQNSTFDHLTGSAELTQKPQIAIKELNARLVCSELYPWLSSYLPDTQPMPVKQVGGLITLKGVTANGPLLKPAQLNFSASGKVEKLSLVINNIPGTVTVAKGQFRVTPKLFSSNSFVLKHLDTQIQGSVKLTDYLSEQVQIKAGTDGKLGIESVRWLNKILDIPSRYRLKQSIVITNASFLRDKSQVNQFSGDFSFAGDLNVSTKLTVSADLFNLEKLVIKDDVSNASARLSHIKATNLWSLYYNGNLSEMTLSKLWPSSQPAGAWIRGDLQALYHPDAPSPLFVQGDVSIRKVQLPVKTPGPGTSPVRINSGCVTAHGGNLMIHNLDLTWEDQNVSLEGDVNMNQGPPGLDLHIFSDTFDMQRIAQALTKKKTKSQSGQRKKSPGNKPDVYGKIQFNCEHFFYGEYHWAPMQASIAINENLTTIEITQANLCKIATLGVIKISPQNVWMKFSPVTKKNISLHSNECLPARYTSERIKGDLYLNGVFTSKGKTKEQFIRNMKGEVKVNVVNGHIVNIGSPGFFTNILTYFSINNLIQGDVADLQKNDFHYKTIFLNLGIANGSLNLNEAHLTSNSLNMAGTGKMDILTKKADFAFLVSPLTTVDSVVEKIPIFGRILGGTLVAIPVGVSGPINDPKVIPLSGTSVGKRVAEILKQTMQTPFHIISPLLPEKKEPPQEDKKDD
ncbi:MAG: hypothetical protein GY874_06045 [Desulfobacteraceae bacterium]|nr:hypothetical protein [Desulfobacteraceae bacterium]